MPPKDYSIAILPVFAKYTNFAATRNLRPTRPPFPRTSNLHRSIGKQSAPMCLSMWPSGHREECHLEPEQFAFERCWANYRLGRSSSPQRGEHVDRDKTLLLRAPASHGRKRSPRSLVPQRYGSLPPPLIKNQDRNRFSYNDIV